MNRKRSSKEKTAYILAAIGVVFGLIAASIAIVPDLLQKNDKQTHDKTNVTVRLQKEDSPQGATAQQPARARPGSTASASPSAPKAQPIKLTSRRPTVVQGTKGSRMIQIPTGCFRMGMEAQDPDEVPVHKVCLSSYWMDRTEVSVAQYAKCVRAGRCDTPTAFSTSEKWRTKCTWRAAGREQHPVNCLTWHKARAYCSWAGKRLPTEAEWEYAARGSDGRVFPWGSKQPSCDLAVMGNRAGLGCGRNTTWPVGSKPAGASAFGLLDMAGNVWEWMEDCWYKDAYTRCATGCKDPVMRCSDNTKRVIRGASWKYPPKKSKSFRTTLRGFYKPRSRGQGIGFRCARSS